jgi:hypothetical protein
MGETSRQAERGVRRDWAQQGRQRTQLEHQTQRESFQRNNHEQTLIVREAHS